MTFNIAMVTGGAGFIGSHIISELLARDIEVISIDNYLTGKKENIAEFKNNPNFQEVNCDICDLEELKNHFNDIDVIFHNAASKKTICLNDPRRDLDINAKGTYNLLELSIKNDVKKFIHASTGSVYGEGIFLPQNEHHPLNPTSYYGVSKLAGEKYVTAFYHLYGFDTSVLRYFHVYGPKQDFSDAGGVVSIFINQILKGSPITIFGDGTQERSFTYVKDIVAANMLVLEAKETKGEVYNCASGLDITINQLVENLFELLHKDVPIIHEDWVWGDIKKFDIDNSKLKSLGFEFKTDFREGLRNTIDWMKDYII